MKAQKELPQTSIGELKTGNIKQGSREEAEYLYQAELYSKLMRRFGKTNLNYIV